MEQTPHTKAKLTGLIVAVIVIAAVVILLGSLCTCLCVCGSCSLDCFTPDCSGFEWLPDHSDAWLLTAAPTVQSTTASPAPVQTASPVPVQTASPSESGVPQQSPAATFSLGDQKPAPTADPSDLLSILSIREKQVHLRNDGTDTVTVLVLMNGSDLESEYGEATDDLTEMVKARKGDRIRVVVETVGTKKWSKRYGISPYRSQRYLVTNSGLSLVDDTLGQLDTTVPSTLSDFIRWGAENYPADRYILLLWDHGGGPVYGFGYDEYKPYSSTLTIDEMQIALKDGGVYFDLIGMDCCLMSSLEVCCALYDYCDYTLLSEDFEPGCGWEHSQWLSALSENPAISTPELAKVAIDASVRVCEKDLKNYGGLTLALIDEAYVPLLYRVWTAFAYDNEAALLSANYSQLRESNGRAHPLLSRSVGGWFSGGDDSTLSDYCITDILSLASHIPSEKSDVLSSALDAAITYFGATSDETTLTGLSVTLPYGDRTFYNQQKRVYRNAGFDDAYIDWLGKFVDVKTPENEYYDFGDWNGWDDYFSDYDWTALFGGRDDSDYDWFDDAYDVLSWLLGA